MKLLILLLAVVAGGLIDSAAAEVAPRPTAKLTVNGTVVMPDGSPADDAVVTARDGDGEPPTVVRTDRQGRFQIQGEFAWLGCRLHARSSDGKFQTTLRISEMLARDRLSKPVEMKLLPAQERVVTVLADGKPVPGTYVAVALAGSDTCVETTTGADGKTTLRFPANEPVRDLVAWHATLGTAGIGYSKHRLPANDRIPATGVQLSLRVPRPHAVRVVDADDQPVPNVRLLANIQYADDWVLTSCIPAAVVVAGDDGRATIQWCPRECELVSFYSAGSRWKIDDVERAQDSSTVRVRRRVPAKGRLIMPPGISAEGILIKGDAFGTTFWGDLPAARAAANGSFTLMVVSNHGYGISVADSEWSGDVWTGKILANDGDEPVPIELEAYPTAPVEIAVTRGALREPVVEAWIDVCRGHSFDWVDAQRNVRGAGATFSSWIQTDARGVARAGLGRGAYELRLRSGAWEENRKFEVTGAEPLSVEFHRPWLAKRQMISGRFVLDGATYKPSQNAVLKATARAEGQSPVAVDALVHPNGTLYIKEDTPEVSIYFVDGDRRLCGFARVGPDDDSVTIALAPIPDAETPGLEYCGGKAAEDAIVQADSESAIKIYDDLIVLVPDLPSTYQRRGRVFAGMGKYAEAIADFREAIRLDRRDPNARNDLAWILATCPVAEHRHGDEAFQYANTACELTEGKNPVFLATLAAALAEQGDFSQAVKGQKKALSLAMENEKAACARRLELYKARKPFRDQPKIVNGPKVSGE